jgi:hypothetical protein
VLGLGYKIYFLRDVGSIAVVEKREVLALGIDKTISLVDDRVHSR